MKIKVRPIKETKKEIVFEFPKWFSKKYEPKDIKQITIQNEK